jgi:GR25 family glycosyltransferase involved in LPS biosynthesis
MNNIIDVVYYINLNRSTQRRKTMKKILKDETFKHMKKYRIKAIDGNKPNILPYLQSKIVNMNLNTLSIKEYCCLLSHLNTILQFSQSEHEIALICEDDLSLDYKKYWQEDLNTCIQNAPNDWGILQLSIIANKLPNKLYTNKNYSSCAAYLINKKAALNFIKHTYVNNKFCLNKNISHAADNYIYLMIKRYIYKYPFFTYNTTTKSTIHQNHVKSIHIPHKQQIENLLKKRSRKNYNKK